MAQHTTIIRTRFESFEEKEECTNDREVLSENIGKLGEIINKNAIIHLDNPPLIGRPNDIERNKETREESRKILLEHLINTHQSIYKPANLDNLNKIFEKEWKK